MNYQNTYHGLLRTSQRNISENEIYYTVQFGRSGYRHGAKYFFLGRKELIKNNLNDEHLEGLTVIIGVDGNLIIAYKNKSAIKKLKR